MFCCWEFQSIYCEYTLKSDFHRRRNPNNWLSQLEVQVSQPSLGQPPCKPTLFFQRWWHISGGSASFSNTLYHLQLPSGGSISFPPAVQQVGGSCSRWIDPYHQNNYRRNLELNCVTLFCILSYFLLAPCWFIIFQTK